MFSKRVYGNEAKIGVMPHASGKRSEQSEKERKTTETNQWHMIVCIYCRRDSCRSHVRVHTIVCDSRCVYVFQLWDVRSKIGAVVVVVVVVASVMYSIMSLLVARYHLETHYFVLFGAGISMSLFSNSLHVFVRSFSFLSFSFPLAVSFAHRLYIAFYMCFQVNFFGA